VAREADDPLETEATVSRISVGLSTSLAAAYLRDDADSSEVTQIRKSVRHGGGDLVPQAGALRPQDLDTASDEIVWFTGDVDDQAAQDLVGRLLDVQDVRAAYVVAPEGPP
jgi:hypothetical protein